MNAAYVLGGEKEVSKENIDRLIGMRKSYGVTGRHPGFKRYRNRFSFKWNKQWTKFRNRCYIFWNSCGCD